MFAATQKSDAEDMMLEAAWSVPVGTSETLARIARRGYLTAGVSKGVRGLSQGLREANTKASTSTSPAGSPR